MWIVILALTFGIAIGCLVFLRLREEPSGDRELSEKEMSALRKRRLIVLITAAIAAAALTAVISISHPLNAVVVLLHLAVFWIVTMCADGVFGVIRRKRAGDGAGNDTKPADKKQHGFSGTVWLAAMLGCFCYLVIGWVCLHRVWRTEYHFTTEKNLPDGGIRIVQISDVHLGTPTDADDWEDLVKRVAAEKADIVAVTGDLADGGTDRELLRKACARFAELTNECEVYFIDGNHDVSDDCKVPVDEIYALLRQNGVTVLSDEVTYSKKGICVIGRKDRSEARDNMAMLTKNADTSRYTIVLDHQPNDFEAEAAAGVDLVLTGHTHGGFLLPIRWFAPFLTGLFGDADRYSGTESRDGTNFVVNSGVGTWGVSFKTGARSEYTVIDVTAR
ncbi:MAG: metallophosphoesterase [Lachnospiraceae bacterium]|nr:metallophosphoesterase [Lachnospiraceae bacterium]